MAKEKKMKLVIITAVHGRKAMTLAFLKAMDRVRRETGVETYIVATHDDSSLPEIQKYGFPYVEHENKPVGKKFNYVVDMLKGVDFTHAMILGSDDIPSTQFIMNAMEYGEYDISGVDGLWFWGLNPRRAGFERFGYFPIKSVLAGPGKVLSKEAIEGVDWAPWPDNRNGGMDAAMMKKIRMACRQKGVPLKIERYSIRDTGGFLLDVKYQSHISSLSPILRRDCYVEQDPNIIIPQHLPMDEARDLFDLYEETLVAWDELKRRG
jgi:hypothetical protein